MVKNSLWNKDKLSKIDNPEDYLKEIFSIKDSLFVLKDEEKEKRRVYNLAKVKRRLQEDKLENAYSGLERFRQK